MYIASLLLTKLKSKISLSDGRFEDEQELLDFAFQALTSELYPELIKAKEGFYVTSLTATIDTTSPSLRIPSRAFGGLIREIKLIDSNGRYIDLERIEEEDLVDVTQTGQPEFFYIRGNRINFVRSPDQSYNLLVTYWLQPSTIVLESECALITAIAGAVATCSSVPTTWTTSNLLDIVKGTSDYEPASRDLTVSALTSSSITFSSSIASTIEVGDYICLRQETPFAYLQASYFPVLLQYTVSLIHESLGNLEDKSASDTKAEAMLNRIKGVYLHRVQGSPKNISSTLV